MEGTLGKSAESARQILDEVEGVRRRTRQARHAFWFPLIVCAVLTLASSPLYVRTLHQSAGGDAGSEIWGVLGGQTVDHAQGAALFWLIAVPVGYVVIAAFYWWRAYRRGVAASWRTYVLVGIILFALTAFFLSEVAPPAHRWFLAVVHGDLIVRGLLPLVAMAIGFLVLARVERSLEFGVFAVGFLALAITANLYDMSNMTLRFGLGEGGPFVNNLVVGIVLLLASLYFAGRAHGMALRVTLRFTPPQKWQRS